LKQQTSNGAASTATSMYQQSINEQLNPATLGMNALVHSHQLHQMQQQSPQSHHQQQFFVQQQQQNSPSKYNQQQSSALGVASAFSNNGDSIANQFIQKQQPNNNNFHQQHLAQTTKQHFNEQQQHQAMIDEQIRLQQQQLLQQQLIQQQLAADAHRQQQEYEAQLIIQQQMQIKKLQQEQEQLEQHRKLEELRQQQIRQQEELKLRQEREEQERIRQINLEQQALIQEQQLQLQQSQPQFSQPEINVDMNINSSINDDSICSNRATSSLTSSQLQSEFDTSASNHSHLQLQAQSQSNEQEQTQSTDKNIPSEYNIKPADITIQPSLQNNYQEQNVEISGTKSTDLEGKSSRESSRERSESAIKEVPMSGDRNRFSRSRSPKARWHEVDEKRNDSAIENNPAQSYEILNASVQNPEEIEKTSTATVLEAQATNSSNVILNESDIPRVQRKRKWLSNESTAANLLSSKKSLTISSDTLKSYLPTSTSTPSGIQSAVIEDKSEDSNEEKSNSSAGSASGVICNNTNQRKVIEPDNGLSDIPTPVPLANITSSESQNQRQVVRSSSRTVILEVENYLYLE
jgi:hypothetical protein